MSEMSVQDVIKNSDEVKRGKIDWEQMYVNLYKAVQTDKYRAVRSGDTLFIIKIVESHVASLFTFNAEKSFKNYVRNIKEFLKALEISGYEKLYAKDVNIQMINIMKNAGYNIEAIPLRDKEGWYSIVGTKGAK